jgi:1-aminocyclopropane-1-carboxylate deaminase/D-cysteine desulfhydrase-like pyridoxal-dependent ACC family enzyme
MTAAAANRLGLECHLALAGDPHPGRPPTGNLLLDHLLGARLHFTGERGYYEMEKAIIDLAERLAGEGHRPYAIPVGGASVAGAVAYVEAAAELLAQVPAGVDWVVVADGSGGTHAGLLAGLGSRTRVLGVDVGTRPDLDDRVPELAAKAAAAAGREPPEGRAMIDHGHFGLGYGKPTPECLEAIRATARLEGLLLDPVYTGKAMAGLVAWARQGLFAPGDTVLFWHTGGSPALFAEAYGPWLTGE